MSSFQEKKQQKHDHHIRGSINIPFLKVCWQLYFFRLESGNNNLPAWYKVCELHLALTFKFGGCAEIVDFLIPTRARNPDFYPLRLRILRLKLFLNLGQYGTWRPFGVLQTIYHNRSYINLSMNRALVFQGPDISTGEWINKWKEDNTDAVAKWKPEKIQACQNSNPNLCYNGAVLHPIGHFRYIKIQHDIEFDRTRTKKSLAIVLNFIYRKWPIEQASQLGDGHLPGSSRLVCFSPVFFVGYLAGFISIGN